MFLYPEIKYDTKVAASQDIEPDDILFKLKDQLPQEQMDMMVLDIVAFKKKLEEQKKFHPFGEVAGKKLEEQKKFHPFGEVAGVIRQEDVEYRMYKVTEFNEEYSNYLTRIQTLSLFYIDAAEYTDNEDSRFFSYTMFEVTKSPEDGRDVFKLMGYAILYNFYAHPSMVRPRIAQILVLPQYRGKGTGAKFLKAIYTDLRKDPNVKDITAETPADAFVFLRDYIDCIDCNQLESFKKEKLLKGFTKAMEEEAQKILKIHPKQSRRVYEILRLYHTDTGNPAEETAYKAMVKARLEKPMRRGQSDWVKLRKVLDDEEFQVMAIANSEERKQELLEQNYEKVMEEYQLVLSRLKSFAAEHGF
uniref:Histone acetyltransferase type B catalytic subunit n=1 Tax=Acrobeloides nanus TaxID=290746 RepID=A0A914BXH2_9BILA